MAQIHADITRAKPLVLVAALLAGSASVEAHRAGNTTLTYGNGKVELTIDRTTGRYGLHFGKRAALDDVWAEATLEDGRSIVSSAYSEHIVSKAAITDLFGKGLRVTLRHRSPGKPELRQTFWIYAGHAEAITRLEVVSVEQIGSNRLAPIVTETPVKFEHKPPLHSLFVPYDNDGYVHYRSDGWGDNEESKDGSFEVGAIYDDGNRNGLLIGSIDHDRWKSGVQFRRDAGVRAFAGITSEKITRDHQPHGIVHGRVLRSPRMVVGWYDDWRNGLERYGDLNAIVRPPLPWKSDVPFGWSSWLAHMDKISEPDGLAAIRFLHEEMPWFRSGGTAYVNLDSFWDNLKREQRADFVRKAHAAGLKAGIYWSPFAGWGELEWKIGGGPYTYRDLTIKDSNGQPLPKNDGAWPLDPTHPGQIERVDRQLDEFVEDGFDYIKLDFLTNGAVEGKHFDPHVETGTEAYNIGMRQIVDRLSAKRIGRPFFIDLSIAPLFPSGYGHARRTSCDVFANIGATGYFLNSANYAWWEARRLYRFNDPDSNCVYAPHGDKPVTEAEARSRFTASVVGGGMMLDGDDLTRPEGRERVLSIFGNREALDLARQAPAFRPVEGNTKDQPGELFVWQAPDGKTAYVAAFNTRRETSRSVSVSFARLGITAGGARVRDLWTKKEWQTDRSLQCELPPMECALLRLDLLKRR